VTTQSDVVNREVTHLARNHFGVEEIVCLFQDASSLEDSDLQEADVILTKKVLAMHMRNRLSGTETLGVGLGLGEGELRQVTVLPSSPAIGCPLKDIHPTDWLVAAVYRDNKLIVPHGDTILAPGDRVLLVGQPEVLRYESDYVRGGQTIFPNQYGPYLVKWEASSIEEEAQWFLDRTRARRLVTVPLAQLDPRLLPDETLRVTLSREQTGCLVLPPEPIPLADRLGLRRSPRKRLAVVAGTPILIARGSHPYKKILVAVGDDANANATTGVAVDIARQCEASLTGLTILPPSLLDGVSENDERKSLSLRIAKIARNHGIEIDRRVDEGNPLECIRRHAADFDLLVIGLSPRLRNSLLHPDISMYLMHDAPCSVLFVPGSPFSR
jgi:nucleotide-binding universal stress UspA family protein